MNVHVRVQEKKKKQRLLQSVEVRHLDVRLMYSVRFMSCTHLSLIFSVKSLNAENEMK